MKHFIKYYSYNLMSVFGILNFIFFLNIILKLNSLESLPFVFISNLLGLTPLILLELCLCVFVLQLEKKTNKQLNIRILNNPIIKLFSLFFSTQFLCLTFLSIIFAIFILFLNLILVIISIH